jgi:hypothetical protein
MHFINIMNDTVEFQGSFRMIMVEYGVAGMSISKEVTKAAICQSNLPLFKRLENGQTRNFGLQVAYELRGSSLSDDGCGKLILMSSRVIPVFHPFEL